MPIGQNCPTLIWCEGTNSSAGYSGNAKDQDLRFEWRPDLGKGSHGILLLGERRTVVRNPKDELKTGTLHAMLKQLGLSLKDIERY